MRTIIALNNFLGFDFEAKEPPADLYTGEEIYRMDPKRLAGKSREELLRIRQRILDTNNWLEVEDDADIDSPEWIRWERRLDKLSDMDDAIDELLQDEMDRMVQDEMDEDGFE